ncbi:MAG: hypothetical protein ACRD0O_20535 [Acidimicrobiia bacterium]
MARSPFWRIPATMVMGALVGAIPLVATATTSEEQAAAPGVNVCVFYGICVGPALPGR